ncbi:MAG: hypothetical protein L0271_23445 [Gemmatimonadetes bacterium]|nr:hypothetical protein [Gemmatimonadota bacterium]
MSAVLSIGITLGAVVLWLHARAAMRSEMDTTLRSAEHLISAVRSQPGLASLSSVGLTESLDRLRHVRVIRLDGGPIPPQDTDVARVPRWFSRIMAPDLAGFEPIELTVGGAHEQVILQADPSDEIRVPAGAEITFVSTTTDVLHGFNVEGTRLNMMLIPGQISRNTYTFNQPGEHLLICHEYCGLGHHMMAGRVIVEATR